ncbi:type I restriction endonuclease subunit R [Cryobacterium tagatosivorans]|uniref:Type I restriction endonuclease subunit R n=1 Tax=Cryobacterium tagatosivorans TaxID=1259199 RepID=A0A4R8UCQ4_9MICO|nr:type I restriction endonuclease [Cryobacterium tagatosivorans]TFB47261.1 type I restriction endonuclease subunit R [Cryobacterium tagatosivorans]
MDKHNEYWFEDELAVYLAATGWEYSTDDTGYDRELALFPDDVFGWLEDTQGSALAQRIKTSDPEPLRAKARRQLLTRLTQVLDKPFEQGGGTLSVLRHGFKDVSTQFDMCQFRPSQQLNPATLVRYAQVRLRVMRQVHYSTSNQKSLDLVFFVNGLPVATMEVKTDFTQSVEDAIIQYRKDRTPKDLVTKRREPLLGFGNRALVHFAVSNSEVWMSTRLDGEKTTFLPFNMGNDGGKGNPPNPDGSPTSYLWERVLQRDSWLEIIGKFLHASSWKETDAVTGEVSARESLLFPRFHQWESVTSLVQAAREEGPGHRYLIQHSAGSGKTNSIAWTAHQLSSLHDAAGKKMFDSVIVVTDRTVLDDQLQDAIYQIDHKSGVVVPITRGGADSKSAALTKALTDRAQIIIVTIQTFPFALKAIRTSGALVGRSFAVIADEAHSSQTGNTSAQLKHVLSPDELADLADGGEIDIEALLAAEMAEKATAANISFFAYTATPKAKTLELFGRLGDDGLPHPFHVYTMQQAIEEGFILDVLQNYTPYKLAFKLAHNGREYDSEDPLVDKTQAAKDIMRWVKLHDYNIAQKVAVIIEHFRDNIAWRLNAQAKAMVVTGSRIEAVRYKRAFDKYVKDRGYVGLQALVAFSGEVTDLEAGELSVTEATMNPGLKGRSLPQAFASGDYQVMLAANKYQTGFDQPLLVAMYVDKKLSGVTAVQTLSRLNRTATGKDQTFVLDFVNDPQEILAAFLPYYRQASLADVSDPNIIHDLQNKLDQALIYEESEVDGAAKAWVFDQGNNILTSWLTPAKQRFAGQYAAAVAAADASRLEELELFRSDLNSFIRAYDFLSQLINYHDTGLEKRSIFYRLLAPLISSENRDRSIDLSGVKLTHYSLRPEEAEDLQLSDDGDPLKPFSAAGSGTAMDPEFVRLRQVIDKMNTLFEGDALTENDLVGFTGYVGGKFAENSVLRGQAKANTLEQFLGSPDLTEAFQDAVIASDENFRSMSEQVLGSKKIQKAILELLAREFYGKHGRAGAA